MHIKNKILVTFLTITIISILSVTILSFFSARDALLRTSTKQLETLASLKANTIQTFFDLLSDDVSIAQDYYNIKTNLPIMIEFSKDRTNPNFIKAEEMLDGQLRKWLKIREEVADIMLLSPQGKIVYAANEAHKKEDLDKSLSDLEGMAFEEGKKGIFISQIFRSPNERYGYKFGLLVTAPVFDFEKQFIGVVAFEIDMERIYKFIQDTAGLGKTGETLVVRKAGDHVLFLNPLRYDPNAALVRKVKFGDKTSILAQEAASGKIGSGIATDYRNKEALSAWCYMPILGWGIVAKIDLEEVLAPVTTLRNRAVIFCFIIIILVVFASLMIAESISGPIHRLHKGTEIIGSGNLDYKVGTDTKDEIGQLSRAFDSMTENLKKITASRDTLDKEITERKMAEKKLQEAVKAKSAFTSMVSHELRTPLGALKESVSLVSEGLLGAVNEKQKRFLGIAKSNVDRLARLINEVLDFQTLESGKLPFKMRENDINEMVKEVRESMLALAEKKNLDFTIKLGENLPKVRFDRDKINQVLTNLVSNSLKVTEKGSITVTTIQGDNIIQVSVKDTGPGIKEEDMPRLFRQYEQLERKVGGTGLGLAISQEIIHAHGGKIWAESKFGEGTTFHFVLPVKERRIV